MGSTDSKPYKDSKLLHYIHPHENRVSVYLPHKNIFRSFNLFKKGEEFPLYYHESISIPTGAIYIIGGRVPETHNSKEFESSRTRSGKSSRVVTPKLVSTNEVHKINLNKSNEKFGIDLYDIKPCRILPESRTNHLMIYCSQFIFVF